MALHCGLRLACLVAGLDRGRHPASPDHDLRHTYATWSLAARVDIFTLARRMGTNVQMIDRTYGHLITGADKYERGAPGRGRPRQRRRRPGEAGPLCRMKRKIPLG
jgi:integrase